MDAGKRTIINTLAQHIRAIINICMSLFSTRFVLSALGADDFGIFSIVGSVVTLLGFVTNAMVVTTQRQLSFAHGKNDEEGLRKVFSNSLAIHLSIGLLMIVAGVAFEHSLFNTFIKISPDRIDAAKSVYLLAIFMLLLSFLTAPFRALFLARENIVYISIIDFLDGFFKLALAYYLLFISADKLIAYAFMLASITLFNLFAFALYAKLHYRETTLLPKKGDIDFTVIKYIIGFAGWTIYSTGCILGRTQGVAILLNRFFGTLFNASYGIASQVAGSIQFVSQSVLNAMSPQIIRAEGAGDRKRMLMLSILACKYATLLLAIVVMPLVFEMPTLLSIWLGDVPVYAVTFCQFILLTAVVDQTTIGLGIANQAIGKIRTYSVVINSIKLSTLLLAWICLKMGESVISVMWCYIAIEALCALARIPFLHYTAGLSINSFVKHVYLRILVPIIVLVITDYSMIQLDIPYRFIITFIISIVTSSIVMWFTSVTEKEKIVLLTVIKKQQ